ncbi:MAG: carbohydrate kinase [Gammaproteobacteria bacterium]|jgi:fructokinase
MQADTRRPVLFGEVLFDHFPDGSVVLGGAPFNVAWHLQAFGARPLLVSRVGDDPLGRKIRAAMQAWDMDCSGLQLDSSHPTGTVEVSLEGGEPSYEIVPHRAYDFVDGTVLPPLPAGSILYHGSLALRHEVSRAALQQLRARLQAPSFVDVNLRPPWWDRERVVDGLRQARWAKLNGDELRLLYPQANGFDAGIEALLADTHLQVVVATRGARGALIRTRSGNTVEAAPKPGHLELVDAVGAGDAFASVLLLGLLRDWPLEDCLERAQAFASAMVGVRGATVDKPEFYERFRAYWET